MFEKEIATASTAYASILPRVNSFLERYAVDWDEKKDKVSVADLIKYSCVEFVSVEDNKLWTLVIAPKVNDYGFVVIPSDEFHKDLVLEEKVVVKCT
jgi:hypothetical protein